MTVTEIPVRPRGGRRSPLGLVGRAQDLDVIQARVAQGAALLLRGEPGVGKSALLDVADEVATAAGLRVIRAAGADFEEADFFTLNQLLLPLRAHFGQLNPRQREALDVALGLGDGPDPGRLVVSNAALALLERSAADCPPLLIVDNLHQVDLASALVLGFISRRLRGSRIGLIAAQRAGNAGPVSFDMPRHEVKPLDDDASARLLTLRFPGLAPATRERVVAEARGNPLALLELPAALSERQRLGLVTLPDFLPLPDRLRALLSARVSALPAATVYLLLLAALAGQENLGLLREVADHGDLARAEQAGLVRVDENAHRVTFAHPVIRKAVLDLSPPGEIRRAHLELAAHIRDQPRRRAWHLAGAVSEPGDPGDPGDPARRLATAAYLAASVIGDLGAAEALLADYRQAAPGLEPPAEARLATAFVLLHGDGDLDGARRLLTWDMKPRSAEAALWTLEALRPDAESPACQVKSAEILRIAGTAVAADRLPDCRQALRRLSRQEPSGTAATQAGILLALESYQTGQWDEAGRLAEGIAADCGRRGYQLLRRQAQTVLALVAVGRGDTDAAQALADDVAGWAAPRGITSLRQAVQYVDVLLALARSDYEAAYQQAGQLSQPGGAPVAAWALLDRVESALRTDRPQDAAGYVTAARQAGLAKMSARMALLVTAATAMTAPDDKAPGLFDQALAIDGADRWPFETARVRLLAGERLRRIRAMTAARAQLGPAVAGFRRLGAVTWADRAAAGLRAAGQVPPRVTRVGLQVLSPQELEIAQLAATGLSNKEIARRLFISHRTVASHLFRIFPKLGITSRAALGQALAGGAG